MEAAADVLDEFGVPNEVQIVSAHRTPHDMVAFGAEAEASGVGVIIAGAGGAAHLPGMLASLVSIPVIGVPVPLRHLDGMDSLLSIVQMPIGCARGHSGHRKRHECGAPRRPHAGHPGPGAAPAHDGRTASRSARHHASPASTCVASGLRRATTHTKDRMIESDHVTVSSGLLTGKRLLITGVATEDSIALATARRAGAMGAEVVLTAFPRDVEQRTPIW